MSDVDDRLNKYKEFLVNVTSLSKCCLDEDGHSVLNLAKVTVELFQELKNEVVDRDMTKAYNNLVQCFLDIVNETKHYSSLSIPYLNSSKYHLEIIHDIMRKNGILLPNDKKDLSIALKKLSKVVRGLISNSKNVVSKLPINPIRELKTEIQSKKEIVETNHQNFILKLSVWGAASGLGAGACAGRSLVASSSFGCEGTFVIAETPVSPVAVVLATGLIGAAISAPIIYLIKQFNSNRQEKALTYLNTVLINLSLLDAVNIKFVSVMKNTEINATKLYVQIDYIQSGLESESGRYANKEETSSAVEATCAMIEVLKEIEDFDVSEQNICLISMN